MKKQTLSENTTCQSESYPRHSERSEESTCNREILQSHSFLQNDNLTRHPEAITRHSEAQAVPCGHPDSYGSPSACQRLKQESNKNPLRHPEETQCPKDLRVSKEIFARDVGEVTNIILKPYCLSSGVSGQCPDGIRLEIFKLCNENLLCRSEQKFSLQSFKIYLNYSCFLETVNSELFFDSFLNFYTARRYFVSDLAYLHLKCATGTFQTESLQSKRKEMNIIEGHFEHSSYLKQESTCQIKHSKLL